MPERTASHRPDSSVAAARPVGVFVGLATLDVIHYLPVAPGANEKVTATDSSIAAGGPAANAAVTFAGLGGDAVLITAIGRHPVGDLIRADLDRYGVRVVDLSAEVDSEPALSAITVSGNGDRSVVSMDATGFDLAEIPDLAPWIGPADILLIDGHHPALADVAARTANRLGVPVVIDAGRWKPQMATLVPQAGTVICSGDFRVPGSHDVRESAARLVADGNRIVITTQGAEAVLWWEGGRHGEIVPPRIAAVDTLGAGDVFHGAYCFFATQEDTCLTDRLGGAASVAAVRCARRGARAWLSDLPHRSPRPSPGTASPPDHPDPIPRPHLDDAGRPDKREPAPAPRPPSATIAAVLPQRTMP
ncbi:sugar/nucleoside kinase (ribokinase family) [Nakamurella flavida]|uniref:PfkB family carbohydrate kinase n=1 Tax=Nakamurella flavida TaxID=363630 RepID=UPI002783D9A8|nr:PfkB family carbohydrate kinase [Nakamurella flavida]MDP9776807.1 sugar/nucleoside kinase (ribokinase family) [Nakamurella flavida]